MKVLGVSFDYHDAAAALVVDGAVVCAVQEERLSRIKHDPSLPKLSIKAVLDHAGLTPCDLDAVVFYEDPLLKYDRIARMGLTAGFGGLSFLMTATKAWIAAGKFDPRSRLADALGIAPGRIHYGGHHLSHSDSAFWCSPFEEALVLTIDGVGEYDTFTASVRRRDGTILRVGASKFPQSIGLFYSAMTAYLGFEVNEGEYKVMGMAAFGEPVYRDAIDGLMRLKNGQIRLAQSYFDFSGVGTSAFRQPLVDLLGAPRVPESDFDPRADAADGSGQKEDKRFADIAASVQRLTEDRLLELVQYWRQRTGLQNICMAGGVALNSLANGRIQAELGGQVYIHPAAGDAGGALGAAIGWAALHDKANPPKPLETPYLGLSYDDATVSRAIDHYPGDQVRRFDDDATLTGEVADRLAAGQVIGFLNGRFEWGPRALGARSIIASPVHPDMKERVNRKIKFREPFRPFAPAVPIELAARYFDLPGGDHPCRPETYMLSVCPVKPEFRDRLPAITHVDGTARVQLVRTDLNPVFHDLLMKVGARTGFPVLLNTSFNLRGEPMVSSPEDALQTFEWSEMDSLVLGRTVVNRVPNDVILAGRLRGRVV